MRLVLESPMGATAMLRKNTVLLAKNVAVTPAGEMERIVPSTSTKREPNVPLVIALG